jgi:hypothetical protein
MPGPIFFGAVRPERGLGAGLVMPFASTPAMAAHLAEISAAVAPGAHAVLVLDQAGWHGAGALVVPDNITLLPLPPYSPELNPVENVWQYLRQNWFSFQVREDYLAIVEACCQAWNRFLARPEIVRSITTRTRARVNAQGRWSQRSLLPISWTRRQDRGLELGVLSASPRLRRATWGLRFLPICTWGSSRGWRQTAKGRTPRQRTY